MRVSYQLWLDIKNRTIKIEMQVQAASPVKQLTLPAWIPGSYMIRDFARHLVSLSGKGADNQPLGISKTDKQTWRLDEPQSSFTIDYLVYANDLSVRGAYLNSEMLFVNGTSIYLRPDNVTEANFQIVIHKPEERYNLDWKLATTLTDMDVDARGFGGYGVSHYAEIIDSPLFAGELQAQQFELSDVPHRMLFCGRHQADLTRLAADLKPVLNEHIALFGELPVEQYLFMTMVTTNGYGGLEHLDSTALICSRKELPDASIEGVSEDYQRYLGLCSHEYFHLWNVKRIQPAVMQQPDLSQEVYTPQLWSYEGITSYYDELALLRSGCIDIVAYLKQIAKVVTRVVRGSGRELQSIAESSFDAWTKFYKQDENAPNAIVSYYAKGSLVAFGLDIELRLLSDDQYSLNNVMRQLWLDYGSQGVGTQDDTIETICVSLVGEQIRDFFALYVRGTVELPLDHWFASVGIASRLRAKNGSGDDGSASLQRPDDAAAAKASLDALVDEHPAGVAIRVVYKDGLAANAGLAAKDILLAVDGYQVNKGNLDATVAALPLNQTVKMHAFRDGLLLELDVLVEATRLVTCELWPMSEEQLTDAVRWRRESWQASLVRPENG